MSNGINGTNSSSFNFNFQMPTDLTSDLVSNPDAQAAMSVLEQLAQSVYGGTSSGASPDSSSNLSLASPFAIAQLTELINGGGDSAVRQQLARKLADMNTAGSRHVTNNITVNVPGLSDRSATIKAQTAAVLAALQSSSTPSTVSSTGSTLDSIITENAAALNSSKSTESNRTKFDGDLLSALKDGTVSKSEHAALLKDLNKALAENPDDGQYYKNDVALANSGQFSGGATGTHAPLATANPGIVAAAAAAIAAGVSPQTASPATASPAETSAAARATANAGANSTPSAVDTTPITSQANTTAANPADTTGDLLQSGALKDPTQGMSETEKGYYKQLAAQDQGKADLFALQTRMQKLNEMITFLTQMMTIRHDNAKAILQNLHV